MFYGVASKRCHLLVGMKELATENYKQLPPPARLFLTFNHHFCCLQNSYSDLNSFCSHNKSLRKLYDFGVHGTNEV